MWMKKTVSVGVAWALWAVSSQAGTYSWGHATNLTGHGFSAGWLVYLYESTDPSLGALGQYGGILPDLTTVDGDVPAGPTTTLMLFGKSGLIYSSSFNVTPSGAGNDVQASNYVFTVVFNTSGPIVPGVTQYTWFNTQSGTTPYQVIVDPPGGGMYVTTGTGNGWFTVAPEPGTLALMATGLASVLAVRRLRRK